MASPVPIKIALVCAIPLLHISLAQTFGLDIHTLPRVVVMSLKFFPLAYISWIAKAPLLAKLWAILHLDERSAASSMWVADNVHLLSITGTYTLMISAQEPWHPGHDALIAGAAIFSLAALLIINPSE
jgi:hypothetical protein